MREIKFRGFSLNKARGWIYGFYNYTFERGYFSQSYDDVPERCHYIDLETDYYEVDRSSVGQYTGLKDKDGIEIYEGDILLNKTIIHQPDGKLTTKIIGDIQILNGMTYLIGKTWQDVDGEDIRISEYKSLLLNPELFRIIGNIYENPDIRDNN